MIVADVELIDDAVKFRGGPDGAISRVEKKKGPLCRDAHQCPRPFSLRLAMVKMMNEYSVPGRRSRAVNVVDLDQSEVVSLFSWMEKI